MKQNLVLSVFVVSALGLFACAKAPQHEGTWVASQFELKDGTKIDCPALPKSKVEELISKEGQFVFKTSNKAINPDKPGEYLDTIDTASEKVFAVTEKEEKNKNAALTLKVLMTRTINGSDVQEQDNSLNAASFIGSYSVDGSNLILANFANMQEVQNICDYAAVDHPAKLKKAGLVAAKPVYGAMSAHGFPVTNKDVKTVIFKKK